MRVLVFDDYEEDFEPALEIGILIEKIDDESYVMNLPNQYKVFKGIVPKSSLPEKEDLKYSENLGCSNLVEYVKSDDDSLTDFVTYKNLIVASSKFEEVEDKTLGYDYECKSGVRFFKNMYVSVVNFRLAGENDYAGYLEFVDKMLGASMAKSENVKKNK